MTTHPSDDILERIESKRISVGVIGLGYVGLPLALTLAEAGIPILGFDTDRAKIDRLAAGDSYLGHIEPARIRRALDGDRLSVTADFLRLAEPDAVVVCVPTPLTAEGSPDLTYVEQSVAAIAERLRPHQLVVLESTTYPGTCDEVLLPILSARGAVPGRDFFLAYSPEREDPGNPHFSIGSIPKVVGGVDAASTRLAAALYRHVAPRIVTVSSTAVAEATKITENVFRAVNIALVNELKMVYDRLGIDIWEVLDAAETKPFGFMRFDPGPGWGGHCIPIDPFYLAWRSRQAGLEPRFVELAGEVNTTMPDWVIAKLEAALGDRGRALAGASVLLLGLAYKPDVDDPRESPAFELLERLLRAGAETTYHDPHVPICPSMRSWPELPRLRSQPLTAETLATADAVVIVTPHRAIDWQLVHDEARLIVDTRGVFRQPASHVVKA